MRLDLSSVHVVGFFSLPTPSLAEHNPAAYAAAMSEVPAGAGSCSHCGTGILHHVIVADASGKQSFIGTTCALKIGSEPVRRCVRERKTSAQLAAEDAAREARNEATRKAEAELAARRARVAAKVKGIAAKLADGRNGFRDSIARELNNGILPTGRAMNITLDILSSQEGRRNSKAYSAAWERYESLFASAES